MEPENNILQEINVENEFTPSDYGGRISNPKIDPQYNYSVFVTKVQGCSIYYDVNKNFKLNIEKLTLKFENVPTTKVIWLRVFVGKKVSGSNYKYVPIQWRTDSGWYAQTQQQGLDKEAQIVELENFSYQINFGSEKVPVENVRLFFTVDPNFLDGSHINPYASIYSVTELIPDRFIEDKTAKANISNAIIENKTLDATTPYIVKVGQTITTKASFTSGYDLTQLKASLSLNPNITEKEVTLYNDGSLRIYDCQIPNKPGKEILEVKFKKLTETSKIDFNSDTYPVTLYINSVPKITETSAVYNVGNTTLKLTVLNDDHSYNGWKDTNGNEHKISVKYSINNSTNYKTLSNPSSTSGEKIYYTATLNEAQPGDTINLIASDGVEESSTYQVKVSGSKPIESSVSISELLIRGTPYGSSNNQKLVIQAADREWDDVGTGTKNADQYSYIKANFTNVEKGKAQIKYIMPDNCYALQNDVIKTIPASQSTSENFPLKIYLNECIPSIYNSQGTYIRNLEPGDRISGFQVTYKSDSGTPLSSSEYKFSDGVYINKGNYFTNEPKNEAYFDKSTQEWVIPLKAYNPDRQILTDGEYNDGPGLGTETGHPIKAHTHTGHSFLINYKAPGASSYSADNSILGPYSSDDKTNGTYSTELRIKVSDEAGHQPGTIYRIQSMDGLTGNDQPEELRIKYWTVPSKPKIWIYKGSEWVEGIPWVYSNGTWHEASNVFVYKSGEWQQVPLT